MKKKKSIAIGITSLLLVTLLLLGLTYAYYRTKIVGNSNDKSVSVTSKKIVVKYQNESSLIDVDKVKPGDTFTKTFEVYNSGDTTAYYAIVFDNVVNEFTRTSDWTYTLSEGSNEVASGTLPTGDDYILTSVSIDAGVTKNYTLKIAYANLKNIDQSGDMQKRLSFRINIEDAVVSWENAGSGTLLYLLKNNQPVGTVETTPGQPSNSTPTSYIEQPFDETVYEMTITDPCTDSSFNYNYGTGYTFDENTGFSVTGFVRDKNYSQIYSNLKDNYIVHPAGHLNCWGDIKTTGLSRIYKIVEATENKITYQVISAERIGGEARILETEDDYGTSYVYRGNVTNNYVNYSGMCWRIVRVQGDGTIKLVLADENGECDASSYSIVNSSSYINNGTTYKYKELNGKTPSTDDAVFATSDLVPVLKSWLENKKIDTAKLVNAEWCNDTSVASYYDGNYDIPIFNSNRTIPTLKCDMKGGEGTKGVESEAQIYKGNIGILNADETVFAGAVKNYEDYDQNSYSYNYYLQANTGYTYGDSWTMTPAWKDFQYLDMLALSGNIYGFLYDVGTGVGTNALSVRPAIVLKSSVLATTKSDTVTYGQPGTHTNPYVIS